MLRERHLHMSTFIAFLSTVRFWRVSRGPTLRGRPAVVAAESLSEFLCVGCQWAYRIQLIHNTHPPGNWEVHITVGGTSEQARSLFTTVRQAFRKPSLSISTGRLYTRIPVLPSLHRLIFNAVDASYATDLSGFPKLRELSPTCPHGGSTVQQQSRLRHPYRSVSPLIRPRLNRQP